MPDRRWWLRLVVAAPALVLVGYALVAFLLPTSSRVEWFVNGDHVRHLVLVADERARGALSYEIRPYPRGWHTSVALLWSALGGPGSPPQLAGLIDLMSTCAWLLSAALALATATLGAAVATRVGLRPVAACVAAAVAASVTLWPLVPRRLPGARAWSRRWWRRWCSRSACASCSSASDRCRPSSCARAAWS